MKKKSKNLSRKILSSKLTAQLGDLSSLHTENVKLRNRQKNYFNEISNFKAQLKNLTTLKDSRTQRSMRWIKPGSIKFDPSIMEENLDKIKLLI